jgi:hypothetical protein
MSFRRILGCLCHRVELEVIMQEEHALYIFALGAVVALLGLLWLYVRAFREGVAWGLAVLLVPPVAVVFIIRHFRKAIGPICLLVLAGLIGATPYAVNYYEQHFMPLQPYEQMVDGELRITVTGLTDFDYATLKKKLDTVVLQMANPEVDDQTLEYLKGMEKLRDLDLNGTRITDQGLAILATLPNLKTLRLARTKITDDGFRTHLLGKETLVHLDLTSTEVKGKTKREWKKHRPAEREYVD